MTTNLPEPGPSAALPHRRAAAVLRESGRLAEAEAALREAVRVAPDDPDASADLGLTLSMMRRHQEAEPCYRRALELKPDDMFSLSNLASTLKLLNQADEAEVMFRRLLEIDPDHVPALRNFAVLLKDSARHAEAKALTRRAAELEPTLETYLQAQLALTPIVRSPADIEAQRAAYAQGLDALADDRQALAYAGEKLNLPWYYLAYHGQDDRALLERTASVMASRVIEPDAPGCAAWAAPGSDRRIRIAFCSEFFFAHTIGRLYRGLIRELDRRRFEVIVLHAAAGQRDGFRDELDGLADAAHVLPRDPSGQREMIAALAPDVMFFPDIGMSAQTYFLAQSRLAPVQATSWGHPNTTGLATMDYFVSADRIEADGAEAFYGERLVRLGRLPCFYDPPPPPPAAPREALQLPGQGTLYGCPQSLFKIHPDFDAVLAEIAEGDPDGHIVMLDPVLAGWKSALRERWAATFPVLAERAVFLPRLRHEGFMAHLAHIDVLLDPLHFGSGNTLYEALSLGTPIVTTPGAFMRGRIVAAAYEQMAVPDAPVSATAEGYAPLALALGRDAPRRERLRAELKARAAVDLYGDGAAVREFGAFLAAAVAAAAEGERLPSGWRPPVTETTR